MLVCAAQLHIAIRASNGDIHIPIWPPYYSAVLHRQQCCLPGCNILQGLLHGCVILPSGQLLDMLQQALQSLLTASRPQPNA